MLPVRAWWRRLLHPGAPRAVLTLVTTGVLLGMGGVVAFNTTVAAISTEAYCISCHEMKAYPYARLRETAHFSNAEGLSATCADCHIPRAFLPKMVRKIKASREVWGHMLGVLDTPEKYAAHRPVMRAREIERMRASDSRECRDCHNVERMALGAQSPKAQAYHQALENTQKTCIDCHTGLAHPRKPGENIAMKTPHIE